MTTAPSTAQGAKKEMVLTRLHRLSGQLHGIENMVEADRYCIDVVTQITAVQAALDKVALQLLDDHARHCILDADGGERDQMSDELMDAVKRLLRHG